jgi:hypothetical protein
MRTMPIIFKLAHTRLKRILKEYRSKFFEFRLPPQNRQRRFTRSYLYQLVFRRIHPITMSFFDKIARILFPPDTPVDRLIREFHLRRDPDIPVRYWINDIRYIEFLASTAVSVENARQALTEHYQHPQVLEASRYQIRRRKSAVQHTGILDEIGRMFDTRSADREMWEQVPKKSVKPDRSTDLFDAFRGDAEDFGINTETTG